jgi:hypothetical protein
MPGFGANPIEESGVLAATESLATARLAALGGEAGAAGLLTR